jgi:fructokinase
MNTHAQTTCLLRNQVVGTGLVALDRIHVGEQGPLFEELGGSCGNVLISLAMLGRAVAPLLRLGNDPVGSRLESDLRMAGADTRLVSRHQSVRSPIIVELLDLSTSDHTFSFTCPQSSEQFGSFQPITIHELESARAAVASCTIFYADRISETICDAMEMAAAGGAIVHFEPSGIGEADQFERALSIAHIFKYSVDRLSPEVSERLRPDAFTIVTAGRSGLEVRHAGVAHQCKARDVHVVRDTCGAGDMVTLGLLDTIIQTGICDPASLSISTVLAGIRSGQQLAAANCAYVGARGIFRECGPGHVREILTDA